MRFKTQGEVAWASSENQFIIKTKEWRYQKPIIDERKCKNCGICSLLCASGCIEELGNSCVVDLEYCKGCGVCARLCPQDAIRMERER
jgi:pyruvate ferredoxin oxidoreductase delta subunit